MVRLAARYRVIRTRPHDIEVLCPVPLFLSEAPQSGILFKTSISRKTDLEENKSATWDEKKKKIPWPRNTTRIGKKKKWPSIILFFPGDFGLRSGPNPAVQKRTFINTPTASASVERKGLFSTNANLNSRSAFRCYFAGDMRNEFANSSGYTPSECSRHE